AWMTSNILTFIGFIGSVLIAAGYLLSAKNINYIWLSSLGFIVNWYGDSLDGTLARVRNRQRPVFGYYLDHTMDVVCELIMFLGLGLSGLIKFEVSVLILVLYLMLTLNVSINAHLKNEFRLTYAKLGPTEFRVLGIIANTIVIYVDSILLPLVDLNILNRHIELSMLDIIGIVILFILILIYSVTVIKDLHDYSIMDPVKEK
ncbi:MAG: CDP-alcohol phosphatidyltransferase family protein, partial [Phocaeicola sp.]|nr:CDP-alcohol phosphatidyltransferase family protein [Phocaeicola sp.]